MKKITFMLVLLLMAVAVQAQTPATVEKQANCTVDASGNYVAVAKTSVVEQPVATGKTFTDSKGREYPVMKSTKGRLFVVKTSAASGKEYRYYLEPANPASKPITQ